MDLPAASKAAEQQTSAQSDFSLQLSKATTFVPRCCMPGEKQAALSKAWLNLLLIQNPDKAISCYFVSSGLWSYLQRSLIAPFSHKSSSSKYLFFRS